MQRQNSDVAYTSIQHRIDEAIRDLKHLPRMALSPGEPNPNSVTPKYFMIQNPNRRQNPVASLLVRARQARREKGEDGRGKLPRPRDD